MTELVPPHEIEEKVGVPRHSTEHYGRAVSAEQTTYILHSQECLDSGIDLRECPFSQALDNPGIQLDIWYGAEDKAVRLAINHGELIPHGR